MIMKIHKVISGPYESEDDDTCYNICLVEYDDGAVEDTEIELDSFDEAYEMIKHLSKTIDPIVVDFGKALTDGA